MDALEDEVTNEGPTDPITAHQGTLYPEDHVVAIVADGATAAAARSALCDAGWSNSEIEVLAGQELLDRHQRLMEGRGLLDRLGAALASDERVAEEQYLDEAAKDRHFVIVRAPTREHAYRVASVLAQHHAYGMRHFGQLLMTDLQPQLDPRIDTPPTGA